MPFALLQRLPGLANLRSPYRFQMPAALGVLVAVAMLLQFGLKKMGSRPRMAALVALTTIILFDPFVGRSDWPFKVMGMPQVPFYETIRKDPSDTVLLEIPVGVRHGTDRIGTDGEILTFYQPVHQKRMVNGLATRAPYAAMEYYRRSPALMFFAGEKPPPGDIDADLAHKLVELDVGYVLVHPNMLKPDQFKAVMEILNRSATLTRVMEAADLVAFLRGDGGVKGIAPLPAADPSPRPSPRQTGARVT